MRKNLKEEAIKITNTTKYLSNLYCELPPTIIKELENYKYPPSGLYKYKQPFFHSIETEPKENYYSLCSSDWSTDDESLIEIRKRIGEHHIKELKQTNLTFQRSIL